MKTLDNDNLLHLIVVNKRKGQVIISVKYKDFSKKDPEKFALYFNPFDDSLILKPGFMMLVEGGGLPPTASKNAVLMFLETSDPDIDDEPYREKMRKIHDFIEKGRLDSITLDSLNGKFPEFQTHETHWLHVLVFQNMLSSLDLEWVGLLDINPFNLMNAIWTIPASPEKEERIRDLVFTELCAQIDRGGTTIGLDVQRMKEYRVLSKRIDRVLELRTLEINDLTPFVISQISQDDGYDSTEVDIEPLWYTAYGYQVLRELSLGKSCDGEDFLDVEEEFKEFGVELQSNVEPHVTYQPNMTQAMKEYIRYSSLRKTEPISSKQDGVLEDIIRGIMS